MNVGFIGLGAMGLPMAERVVRAGFPVITMVHRRREPAERLALLGAMLADTPADVARAADVVITILPADAELKDVCLGAGGLVNGMSEGRILIDMTTCTAATLLEIEAVLKPRGVRVLDAPVSGGTTGAAQGTLTAMVGGDAALLEELRPLLATMASNIVHVGAVGQGKVAKIVNQAMAAIHLLAIGEAFSLGMRCGADPETLYNVIKESSGYSKMMDLRLPGFLLRGFFEPGFKLDLMKKDVNLALASSRAQAIPLPLTSAAALVFSEASSAGHGNEDFSAAAEYLAGLSAVSLAKRAGAAANENNK